MKKFLPAIKKSFNKTNIILTSILLLASFLRLYKIQDYMTFLGDEGRDVLVVYNILHGHLTLLGPTSSVGGFFLGPIYYYFMAPFLLLFNYNPVGPAVMVALVGVLTVWLVYKVAAEFFNRQTGLISAMLYAISPIVIIYSHSSWNPNTLPFFSLLILYLLYKASLNNNLKLMFVVGLLFGIAMQLHYLAVFLGVIVLAYTLIDFIYRQKGIDKLKELGLAYLTIFIGFILGWSPFLAFEVRHGFPDFIHIFDFVVHSGNTGPGSNFLYTVYDVFFRIFARLIFAYPQIDQLSKFTPQTLFLWTIGSLSIAVLSTALLVKYLFVSFRKRKETFSKYLLLSCWLIFGILLFGFYKKEIYEYYFAFMFPLPFILVGNLTDEVLKFKKNIISYFFVTAFIIGVVVINLLGLPFRNPPNRQLNQMKTIARFVLSKTEDRPFNFALLSTGNSDYAYRYFFTIWNKAPVTIEYAGVDPMRKTVTNQLMVVCESPIPCKPLGNSLWEIAGFGQAQIAGHWNVSVVEAYKLVHYKGK